MGILVYFGDSGTEPIMRQWLTSARVHWLQLFSRSWAASRGNGMGEHVLLKKRAMLPFQYAVLDQMGLSTHLSPSRTRAFAKRAWTERDFDVVCTLRRLRKRRYRALALDAMAARVFQPAWDRHVTAGFSQFYQDDASPETLAAGNRRDNTTLVLVHGSDSGGRSQTSLGFHEKQRRAKIIVTCNPSNHEGDSRLWEALASGALVFVDRMRGNIPYALRDRHEVVIYSVFDYQEMHRLVIYYLMHPLEAQRIARAGYRAALRRHRPVNRVDYALTVALYRQRFVNATFHAERRARLTADMETATAAEKTGADAATSALSNAQLSSPLAATTISLPAAYRFTAEFPDSLHDVRGDDATKSALVTYCNGDSGEYRTFQREKRLFTYEAMEKVCANFSRAVNDDWLRKRKGEFAARGAQLLGNEAGAAAAAADAADARNGWSQVARGAERPPTAPMPLEQSDEIVSM
jgi:hypothetical protein